MTPYRIPLWDKDSLSLISKLLRSVLVFAILVLPFR